MQKPSTSRAASDRSNPRPLSAHQRAALAYQQRKLASGLCPKCGKEPLHRNFHEIAPLGLNCLKRMRQRQRETKWNVGKQAPGFREWQPGRPGRPPKWM